MKIRITKLEKLLISKLVTIGLNKNEASLIASEYIQGEMKGKYSHGIFGFIRAFEKKKLNRKKRRKFKVIKNKASYAYIQGNRDYGQLVADYAIKLGIKKAKKSGVAVIGGGNIQSFLRPGTWAEVAAKKGMIAICLNYGGGPLMAPVGAREPILSTNPIGLGIPHKPYPFVLDMAVSERAFWHVRMARDAKKKISKNWGIDKNGRPTTDPNKLTAVLPFGGYKGYALGMAIEILTGPLVRTKVGKSTKKLRGFLFILINPAAFATKKEFEKDVAKLYKDVKGAKKIKGTKDILIPGDRAFRQEQKNIINGYLKIDKEIINKINKL